MLINRCVVRHYNFTLVKRRKHGTEVHVDKWFQIAGLSEFTACADGAGLIFSPLVWAINILEQEE